LKYFNNYIFKKCSEKKFWIGLFKLLLSLIDVDFVFIVKDKEHLLIDWFLKNSIDEWNFLAVDTNNNNQFEHSKVD